MTHARPIFACAILTASLTACGGEARPLEPGACTASVAGIAAAVVAPAAVPAVSPYDSLFVAAGAEFGVPAPLLRALAYLETRWQMVEGQEEFPGLPAAHGVMALRGDALREGARLARVPEAAARREPAANVRAAAALLRSWAAAAGVTGSDVAAWEPLLARYGRVDLPEARAAYAADLEAVLAGRRATPGVGSAARASAADPCVTPPPALDVDHVGSLWRPSPNFNQRAAGEGGKVHVVIVHSCEGAYAGCWSWLASSASQVSAHYVVREDGAEITQLVREPQRAWHIGATYDSTLNAGHDGRLHGVQSNHFTIGVEHAGFASQTIWPEAQLEASARLVCGLAKRWQIPRDRLHIVAHGQLQPYNRTDPGRNWPWADYLARIERHCA